MKERNNRLRTAVRRNDWQTVKKLLEAGADPDGEGPFGDLIFLALLLGYSLVARLLIEAGADLNIADDNGWTPLHWAAKAGDQELIKVMMENEANLLALDRDGNTPLDLLSKYRHERLLEMIKARYPKEYRRWDAERTV